MTNEFDSKEALRLAGVLAEKASQVLTCSVRNLTDELSMLDRALSDYNDYIYTHTK
jgi:hypothetical protein